MARQEDDSSPPRERLVEMGPARDQEHGLSAMVGDPIEEKVAGPPEDLVAGEVETDRLDIPVAPEKRRARSTASRYPCRRLATIRYSNRPIPAISRVASGKGRNRRSGRVLSQEEPTGVQQCRTMRDSLPRAKCATSSPCGRR